MATKGVREGTFSFVRVPDKLDLFPRRAAAYLPRAFLFTAVLGCSLEQPRRPFFRPVAALGHSLRPVKVFFVQGHGFGPVNSSFRRETRRSLQRRVHGSYLSVGRCAARLGIRASCRYHDQISILRIVAAIPAAIYFGPSCACQGQPRSQLWTLLPLSSGRMLLLSFSLGRSFEP